MLYNTAWRLANTQKLTIGYFGGSITYGSGASDLSLCYRSKTTEWFRQTYPDAEITDFNAAIGGTATDLGIYRCGRDLLEKKPDLVFFEFSVNDGSVGDYDTICAYTETIFRKIRRTYPTAEIVTVITVTGAGSDALGEGREYMPRTAHMALSHHFRIPIVDIGEALRARVLLEGGDFLQYTTDKVHPNDAGYAVYTECLTAHLAEMLAKPGDGLREYPLPRLFSEKTYDDAHMEDCAQLTDFSSDGFKVVEKTLCDQYPHYLEGTVPGDTFSFSFTGENLGFYWMLARDSGDVLVSIDGEPAQSYRSWDRYCIGFNRVGLGKIARNLPYGTHRVTVTVSDEKEDQSEGTAIRIGAIMIS